MDDCWLSFMGTNNSILVDTKSRSCPSDNSCTHSASRSGSATPVPGGDVYDSAISAWMIMTLIVCSSDQLKAPRIYIQIMMAPIIPKARVPIIFPLGLAFLLVRVFVVFIFGYLFAWDSSILIERRCGGAPRIGSD